MSGAAHLLHAVLASIFCLCCYSLVHKVDSRAPASHKQQPAVWAPTAAQHYVSSNLAIPRDRQRHERAANLFESIVCAQQAHVPAQRLLDSKSFAVGGQEQSWLCSNTEGVGSII